MSKPEPLSQVLAGIRTDLRASFRAADPWNIFAEGYDPLPTVLDRDPDLTNLQKRIMARAYRYVMGKEANPLYASQQYLADSFGVHVNRVQEAIRRLIELGYLTVRRRAVARRNVYLVAMSVPEPRRALLLPPAERLTRRTPPKGLPPKTVGVAPDSHQIQWVSLTQVVVHEGRRSTTVIVRCPLLREAISLVERGALLWGTVHMLLRQWLAKLEGAHTPAEIAGCLRHVGVSQKAARQIARDVPLPEIVQAAKHLDPETRNLAGALIHWLGDDGRRLFPK
jgi:hypothetical protein